MPKQPLTTAPVPAFAALAAYVSLVSTAVYVLLLLSLHLLEPEFDPKWRFISEYALGQYGWLMVLTFLSLAVSQISTLVAVRSHVRTVVGYIGLVVLLVSAAGILMAAVFRTDPITASPAAATRSGTLHLVGASLDWTPVAALLISLSLARNTAWRGIRTRLFLSAGITLLAMLAFVMTTTVFGPANGIFSAGTVAGLFGRILVLSYAGWMITTALHALALSKRRAGAGASPVQQAANL